MKTETVKDNATFFEKEFREDVERISKLSNDKMAKLCKFITAFKSYSDLNEETRWAHFSKEIDEPLGEVLQYSRPLQYIAMNVVAETESLEDILSDLEEIGIIPADRTSVFVNLISPIASLVTQFAEKTVPSLPLLRIRGISTHCTMIPEFDQEFSTKKDTPDEYSPKVVRLFPVTTLKLTFHNDEEDSVGIQLTQKGLSTLTKWLQLAQVQMDSLTHYAKEHELPVVEEEDE